MSDEIKNTLNIIEQKKLEKELQETKAFLENVLENLPEPVYWMDKNGKVIGCNEAEIKVLDLSPRLLPAQG
jgi:PAS domain-containing protein